MPAYITFKEAISDMRNRGFTHTFSVQNEKLYCSELDRTIEPEKLTLVEQHLVKAYDMANEVREVYGLRTDENVLGIMTSTYAEYDPEGFNDIFRRCRSSQIKR